MAAVCVTLLLALTCHKRNTSHSSRSEIENHTEYLYDKNCNLLIILNTFDSANGYNVLALQAPRVSIPFILRMRHGLTLTPMSTLKLSTLLFRKPIDFGLNYGKKNRGMEPGGYLCHLDSASQDGVKAKKAETVNSRHHTAPNARPHHPPPVFAISNPAWDKGDPSWQITLTISSHSNQ